jgi:phosphate butyryltransferase
MRMPLAGFDQLYQQADARAERVPVAVAGGADRAVLEAVRWAADRDWITPLVCGRGADIDRIAGNHGIALDGLRIVDTHEPAATAVAQVRSGQARILMKGQVSTPALMRAVLDADSCLRTGRVICQVVLMEIPRDDRRFLLADTGICIQPSLEQKLDILWSAVGVAQRLGVAEPRVAIMAASESVTESMPETLEAWELQRRSQARELLGCTVQGPLSFDLAYAAEAAEKKQVVGPVSGAADVLLFPNLVSANLTVKAIMYTADCRYGGMLCGAACPVVFLSRADSTVTRLNSLALAITGVSCWQSMP